MKRRIGGANCHWRQRVVRAAFLAADEGTPITMHHLLRAARAEYQAMGKVIGH